MHFAEIPIPPSTNGLWRSVRRAGRMTVIKSDTYENWLSPAVMLLRVGLSHMPPPVGVLIVIRAGKGWRKNRDIDNCIKAVVDALKHAERITDDTTEVITDVQAVFLPEAPRLPASCFVALRPPCPIDALRFTRTGTEPRV